MSKPTSVDPAPVWALVPAAGIGARMAADRPKQYLPLAGQPVLHHTLLRLARIPNLSGIVLVTAADDPWLDGAFLDRLPVPVLRVTGGAERADSVLAGLDHLASHLPPAQDPWVLVHDAARPGVRQQDITALLHHCTQLAASALPGRSVGAILAQPVRDTVKQSAQTESGSPRIEQTLPRDSLWLAQTPQCFPLQLLRSAVAQALAGNDLPTDEAAAIAAAGYTADLVAGHWQNLKLTTPEDLPLLEWILEQDD